MDRAAQLKIKLDKILKCGDGITFSLGLTQIKLVDLTHCLADKCT
jgi:hypothetical protein